MAFPNDNLTQDAVYWAPIGPDQFGDQNFAVGIAIKCRWENNLEQFLNIQGEDDVSNAQVFVAIDMKLGGALWLGNIKAADKYEPTNNLGYQLIRRYDKIPTLHGNDYERKVYL